MISAKDRLLAKLMPITETGCWIWTGCTDKDGYGDIGVNGGYKRTHRFSYELHKGPIPDGMVVRHTCDIPLCCNPDHLILGTNQDNSSDMIKRKRQHSKLKPEQVLEIRRRYAEGGITHRALANEYGVGSVLIHEIVTYKRWLHL